MSDSRAEFEAWCKSRNQDTTRDDRPDPALAWGYMNMITHELWVGWDAAWNRRAQPERKLTDACCQILKGVGKINGDGWKDTTRIGEVVFVWNEEKPAPYAKGQFPRIGNQCSWTASTEQYDFTPATVEESKHALESILLARSSCHQHSIENGEQAHLSVTSEPQTEAAPVPDLASELLLAVIGLKRVIELAVTTPSGKQFAYIETRNKSFVHVVNALEMADAVIAKCATQPPAAQAQDDGEKQ